jgi:hypothetical protein
MPTRFIDDQSEMTGERPGDDAAALRVARFVLVETSSERFDRMAFAERALALVRPPNTRVALCEGRARVVVESGRAWGSARDARWAVLRVPPSASRRAIAVAALALAGPSQHPYALDVLLGELSSERVA